jgi:hypothetical protein
LRRHLHGKPVILIWDGLSAHRSKAMKAWLQTQRHWLTIEPLPSYAHDLHPMELVWGNLKAAELANLCPDTSTKPTPRRTPDCAASAVTRRHPVGATEAGRRSASIRVSVVSPKLPYSSATGAPNPAPRTMRPPVRRSRVVTSLASLAGRRRATGVIAVPSRIRRVARAAAVSRIHGSSLIHRSPLYRKVARRRQVGSPT